MSTNKPNQDGRFDPVGRCVYCNDSSSRLTDEHIVPYSLLGREILPKASCESCQKITSRFERICARTMFNSLRIREKLPMRRKKERPTSIPVVTNHGEIHLETNDTIATRPIVALLQAGFLQRPPVRKIGFAGARLSVQMSQPTSKDSWSRNKLTEMSIAQTFHLESLARLYAKICHCYAVALFLVSTNLNTGYLTIYSGKTHICLMWLAARLGVNNRSEGHTSYLGGFMSESMIEII